MASYLPGVIFLGDILLRMWLNPVVLVGTHALLPVGVCLVVENLRLAGGLDRIFPPRSLWVVGGFGALPDFCSPHLSLAARYASGSHTVGFLAGAVVLAAAAGSCFENGRRLMVAVACWSAVTLHLAADAVSGGIVPGYPLREAVLGGAYVPFRFWWWCDLGLLVLVGALLRLGRWLEIRRIHPR
jgi:hypothetical protein